jgi:hypothetical protein
VVSVVSVVSVVRSIVVTLEREVEESVAGSVQSVMAGSQLIAAPAVAVLPTHAVVDTAATIRTRGERRANVFMCRLRVLHKRGYETFWTFHRLPKPSAFVISSV